MNLARLIPKSRRQKVINYAFWYAVDFSLKGATNRDEATERIKGLVEHFLAQGWTREELTIASSRRP